MKTSQIRTIAWLCALLCMLSFGLAIARSNETGPAPETKAALTGKVEGTVVDLESGKALTNVLVCIEGCKRAAMTNQYGKFYLDDVPTGICCMKVTKRGYQKVKNDVIIQDGELTKISVKLQSEENAVIKQPESSHIVQKG